MKKVNLNGKLSFKKETIAKLNVEQMKNVQGGAEVKMSLQVCTYAREGCVSLTTHFGGICVAIG